MTLSMPTAAMLHGLARVGFQRHSPQRGKESFKQIGRALEVDLGKFSEPARLCSMIGTWPAKVKADHGDEHRGPPTQA